jgi:integrase
MRIGEFTGLTWNDCDFKKGIISVNHTLLYRPIKNGECELTIHEPKTKSGIRTIPMLEPVRNALLSEKKRQEENGTVKIEIDGYSDWTFTNRYGTVMQPSSINRAIKRITKSYNEEEAAKAQSENREPVLLPDFSAHTMRHTFCTRMCEVEPRVKIIQVIMGHSDIQTTMDIYNTVTDEVKFESFDGLAAKLFTA